MNVNRISFMKTILINFKFFLLGGSIGIFSNFIEVFKKQQYNYAMLDLLGLIIFISLALFIHFQFNYKK